MVAEPPSPARGEVDGWDFANQQLIEWGIPKGINNAKLRAWIKEFPDEFAWQVAVVDGIAGKMSGTMAIQTSGGVTRFVKV